MKTLHNFLLPMFVTDRQTGRQAWSSKFIIIVIITIMMMKTSLSPVQWRTEGVWEVQPPPPPKFQS
jgi:hypothetical protein